MKHVAHTALRAALVMCGVLAVAWLVQSYVFLPSVPLWWRMACVAAPMILGIALVALADRLWGARRSLPRG
jgi:ABC-type multidrug transport system permease subunit